MYDFINLAMLVFISIGIGFFAGEWYWANHAAGYLVNTSRQRKDESSYYFLFIAHVIENAYLPRWMRKIHVVEKSE